MSGTYTLLLSITIWLNKNNLRMLLLTFVVGCGILFPVRAFSNEDAGTFYKLCIAIEIFVMSLSVLIKAGKASSFIVFLSISAISFHLLVLTTPYLDGSSEGSPYPILIKTCELAEILTCILFSINFFKKRRENV